MADILEMALPRERQFDAGCVRFVRRERRKIKPRWSVFQKGNARDCTTALRAAKQERNAPQASAQKRKKKHLPISCAAGNSKKAASETCRCRSAFLRMDVGCRQQDNFEKNSKSVILMKY